MDEEEAAVLESGDSDATACEQEWELSPEKMCTGDSNGRCRSPLEEDEVEEEQYSPLQKDWGFDAQFFERPRFPHSPAHINRPFILSPQDTRPSVQIPGTLSRYLRDYQQEGVQFLYSHYVQGNGAVLCDDMGLGKTVQVIAFMCAVLGKANTKADLMLEGPRQVCSKGCFLVVCPSSVLYNWTNEIDTWSHLKYAVYHREKKEEALDKAKRQRVEVVLTTPDTVRTHVNDLNSVKWLAVFCDEVQVIKGLHSQVTSAMNKLSVKTRYGLTGTALQNNFSELWSILNWARPGCLPSLSTFHAEFERPILAGQKFDCTKRQLADGRRKQTELELKIKKFVIRRTKALIASQLPKKDETVVFCSLTELQENIYRCLLDSEDVQLILHSEEPCDCYSGKKRGSCCYRRNKEGVHWPKLFAEYICLFTKCANHLGLLLPSATVSTKQREKSGRACEEAFSKHPQFLEMSRQASFLTLSDPKYCGKMQVLQWLLKKFHKDRDKVIIFSYSTKLLDILQDYLVSMGYSHCRLDGSTKIEERCKLVQSFNSDPTQFIFLVSKKCGGVGLNLTGANRVVIYDPSWNPATDQQAEDRAFRIGQSRNVEVYRLVTEGTVEEMIYLRQVYKQQLANMTLEGHRERRYFTGVAGDQSQRGELFGCANLLLLRKPGSNLTLDILKRADQMEAGVKLAPNQLAEVVAKTALQMCHSSNSQTIHHLPGTTAIVHSGLDAVVGNSRVEEHITKQATSDVYELQQYSQQPANLVENKMEEFSNESDDVHTPPPPKRSCTESQVDASLTAEQSPQTMSPSPVVCETRKGKSSRGRRRTSCKTKKDRNGSESQNSCLSTNSTSTKKCKTPNTRHHVRKAKKSQELVFISPSCSQPSGQSSQSPCSSSKSRELEMVESAVGLSSEKTEASETGGSRCSVCTCSHKTIGSLKLSSGHPDISELFFDPEECVCTCKSSESRYMHMHVDMNRNPKPLGKGVHVHACERTTKSPPIKNASKTTPTSVYKSTDIIDEDLFDSENTETYTYAYDDAASVYGLQEPTMLRDAHLEPPCVRSNSDNEGPTRAPFTHIDIDELFG